MSETEVKLAQPQAFVPVKKDTLSNGAVCNLALNEYKISEESYKVCFYFKNDLLEQVTLSANYEPYYANYSSILTLLKAKYGQPLSEGPHSLGYEANWITPDGANISVFYMDKLTRLMNISYQVRVGKEREKL